MKQFLRIKIHSYPKLIHVSFLNYRFSVQTVIFSAWLTLVTIFLIVPQETVSIHAPPELLAQFEKQVQSVLNLKNGDHVLLEQMKTLSGAIMDTFKVNILVYIKENIETEIHSPEEAEKEG